jgi:FolB domain-containing protein
MKKETRTPTSRTTRRTPVAGDWIHLRNLKVKCVLGIYPAERGQTRPVLMNLSLECDTRRAAKSDRIEDTLNYEQIEEEVRAVAKKGRFQLVEALAEAVAKTCLNHRRVKSVRVVVDKPGALKHTQSVAVEITRKR